MMGRAKMKDKLTTDLKQDAMLNVSDSPRKQMLKKIKQPSNFNLMSSEIALL